MPCKTIITYKLQLIRKEEKVKSVSPILKANPSELSSSFLSAKQKQQQQHRDRSWEDKQCHWVTSW